jgi:predicted dehydrogenase
MRFLIAGYGSVGRRHLRNLIALGERDILLLRSGRSSLPAGESAEFPAETDLNKALDHKPGAVIVCVPTSLHLDVAIPAARAGCHILLEKPVSHSMDRVPELIEAAHESRTRVCVGFQYRFHPGLRRAKEWIQQGAIGRPVAAHAHYGDYLPAWHPWEDYRNSYSAHPELGGGVILTLCHPLDYLRWLLGEVESVWASSATLGELGIDTYDTAEIGMRFRNGAVAGVHLDYLQQHSSHSFEIVGTEGSIYWDQADGIAQLDKSAVSPGRLRQSPAGFDRGEMFVAEMKHFIQVCRGQAEPVCPLDEGVASLRLSLAALRAADASRPVSLDEQVLR